MTLDFPSSPIADDIFQGADVLYVFNGAKWRRMSEFITPSVVEYSNGIEKTSNFVNIEPDVYSYYKLNIEVATTINLPSSIAYSNVLIELQKNPLSIGNINTTTYDSVSFNTGAQESSPNEIVFKVDGTKMYLLGQASDTIFQYSLSTPWDMSTASLDPANFDISSEELTSRGLAISPDGQKLYVLGNATDAVFQYSFGTAWDVSTLSYDNITFATENVNPFGLTFKPNGLEMYITNPANDSILQYSLSSPWDISTAVYNDVNFVYTTQDSAPRSSIFNSTGTILYMLGNSNNSIFQYSLTTPYDISTMSYDNSNFNPTPQENSVTSFALSSDGSKIYIIGTANDTVLQYTINNNTTTVTWSDSVKWAGGTEPNIEYTYLSTILINLITFDGTNWLANTLSSDSRSS